MAAKNRETVLLVACLFGVAFFGCRREEASQQQPAAESTPHDTPPKTSDSDKLELFTWWTAPGEKEALNALIDVFNQRFPMVKVVDLTEISGGGADAHQALRERIRNNRPPDCFQIYTWSLGEFISPTDTAIVYLDSLYGMKYLEAILPEEVVKTITHRNHHYAVPISMNRRNVLYSNPDLVEHPPKTLKEFFTIAEKLRGKGVPVLAVSTKNGDWPFSLLFESVLAGSLGNDFFNNFYDHKLDIRAPSTQRKMAKFIRDLNHVLEFAVPHGEDYSWEQATDLVIQKKAAMFFHGNWVDGYLNVKKQKLRTTPAPGTQGLFNFGVDSFALCKNAPHSKNARRFLNVVVSPEGQAAFNRVKGGLPVRKDVSVEGWSDAHEAMYADYQSATHRFSMDSCTFDGLEGQVGALYRKETTPASLLSWITDHYDTNLHRFDSPRTDSLTDNHH